MAGEDKRGEERRMRRRGDTHTNGRIIEERIREGGEVGTLTSKAGEER